MIKLRYFSSDNKGDKSKIAPELKKLKNKSYPDFINNLIELCDDPKALNVIKQYFGGPKGENLLDAKKVIIPASQLMPTQNEIDLDKSLKYGLTHPENIKNYFSKEVEIKTPIVTYNGNYIIDGHHRWSQIYIFNPKAKLVCINFEGDLSPIQVLKSTQGSIAADISKVPVSKVDGTSMYDVTEDEIRKYIDKLISKGTVDDLKDYVKSVKDKDSAVDYLVDNSMHLIGNNTPIAHAPKRDFMPQTDQASGALKKLDKSTTVFSNNEKSMFESYYRVQQEGKYNMITEAAKAAEAAGLSIDDYKWVASNYKKLRDNYPDVVDKVDEVIMYECGKSMYSSSGLTDDQLAICHDAGITDSMMRNFNNDPSALARLRDLIKQYDYLVDHIREDEAEKVASEMYKLVYGNQKRAYSDNESKIKELTEQLKSKLDKLNKSESDELDKAMKSGKFKTVGFMHITDKYKKKRDKIYEDYYSKIDSLE